MGFAPLNPSYKLKVGSDREAGEARREADARFSGSSAFASSAMKLSF
jgi:hypothetical protein